MLSRRLFDGSSEPMDYTNICTTVFTPLEYGTVGMSEEDAKSKYSDCKLEIYHTNFTPLEWSLSEGRTKHPAFAKIIVLKEDDKVRA